MDCLVSSDIRCSIRVKVFIRKIMLNSRWFEDIDNCEQENRDQ